MAKIPWSTIRGRGIASKRVNKTTMTVVSQVRWTGGRKKPNQRPKWTWRQVTISHHKKGMVRARTSSLMALMAWWINNTAWTPFAMNYFNYKINKGGAPPVCSKNFPGN